MLVTATEVKNNFGKYLKDVMNDEEVIITRNGKRVAKLSPYITDIERYFTIRENSLQYEHERKRVSYEEFMEIYENSTCRMEFINGEIYLMSFPKVRHQELLGRLYLIFMDFFNDKTCRPFIAPFDVHFRKKDIKDPDVMQPDLLVACDYKNNINKRGKYMGTPALVLEILSSSTRSKDMVTKLNTYMTSGVNEYWIIDPSSERIHVYSFKNYTIGSIEIYKKEEKAESFFFKGFYIDTAELFSNLL